MASYNYGVGILTITDSSTPGVVTRLGVVKDVAFSVKGTTVKLTGEKSFPVDIAVGEKEVTGKGKFASFSAGVVAAATQNSATTGMKVPVIDEAGTPTTNAFTCAGGVNWFADLGVIKVSTGLPMTRMADGTSQGSLTTGQFVVAPSTGVYTFATADSNPPCLFSYWKTDATNGKTINQTNTLMGAGSTFSLNLGNTYRNKVWAWRFPAIVIPTLDFSMGSNKHTEADFTFEAMADASGNVYYNHWTE